MLRGGCFCRAVRYEIDAEPTKETICHCTMCRHVAGAPWWRGSRVPPNVAPVRRRRAAALQVVGACHALLLPRLRHDPDLSIDACSGDLDVTTCSLDEPEQVAPKDHTFVRSKLSWVTVADGLPAYPTTRSAGL